MKQIISEIVSVGLMTSLIGTLMCYNADLGITDWRKLSICLFFLGAIIHILCELSGINKWYCTNGNACITN